MITELPRELKDALAQQPELPLRLQDPDTNMKYVLVQLEVFEQMQTAMDFDDSGEVDPLEVSLLVDQVMAKDDANDPSLASYQNITRDS